MVIGLVAVPAVLVTIDSRYTPGARVIVDPAAARSSAFWTVLNGAAALVPGLVSAPLGDTKYAAPAALAVAHSPVRPVRTVATRPMPSRVRERRRAGRRCSMHQLRDYGLRGAVGDATRGKSTFRVRLLTRRRSRGGE